MLLSEDYREQLVEMHKPRRDGRTWGATACRKIYDLIPWICRDGVPEKLLDYGSADGKFQYQARRRGLLTETEIIEYDPAFPEKAKNNIPCERVMCIDVLEHIEPEFLDDVLKDLHRCTEGYGVFDIALFLSGLMLPDGRDSHLIIEKPHWWKEKLGKYFEVLDSEMGGPKGHYLRVYVKRI